MSPLVQYHNSPDPAIGAVAVTPSDSVDLELVSRGLWVGTGGNLALEMQDGSSVTITNVADGTLLPFRVLRVNATGTTASGIIALY